MAAFSTPTNRAFRRILLAMLILGSALLPELRAQELCANGVDDDGNGLIDLNDTIGCPCTSTGEQPPSLLANPSFEDHTYCPSAHTQFNALLNWPQPSDATTDYLNTCGFTYDAGAAGLLPFPDGSGAVGAFYVHDWKEYVGNCLSTPLLAGETYVLRFDLACSLSDPGWNVTCGQSLDGLFGPLEITLYGAPACEAMPVQGADCPLALGSTWSVLGSIGHVPTQAWGQVSIVFTPVEDIAAFMVGAPCTLPPDILAFSDSTLCAPYFYYDRFILNRAAMFDAPVVVVAGDPCVNGPLLEAVLSSGSSPGYDRQWYLNGVAIPGATGNTYQAPSGVDGEVIMTLTNGGSCVLANAFTLNSEQPVAGMTGTPLEPVPIGTRVELTDTSSFADEVHWTTCDGSVSTSDIVTFIAASPGPCCLELVAWNGACSDTLIQCFEVEGPLSVEIPNVITPNGDGVNDVFRVATVGVVDLDVEIYDRWGLLIHSWSNDPNGAWNGGDAPSGTYYYHVRTTDRSAVSEVRVGHLTVLRD